MIFQGRNVETWCSSLNELIGFRNLKHTFSNQLNKPIEQRVHLRLVISCLPYRCDATAPKVFPKRRSILCTRIESYTTNLLRKISVINVVAEFPNLWFKPRKEHEKLVIKWNNILETDYSFIRSCNEAGTEPWYLFIFIFVPQATAHREERKQSASENNVEFSITGVCYATDSWASAPVKIREYEDGSKEGYGLWCTGA